MAGKRQRVSESSPSRGGNGNATDGDTSLAPIKGVESDQRASIEQMLEILTRQTVELQRLAVLAATATSSSVKVPPKASYSAASCSARRTRERR